MKIRIATRQSPLALWQAHRVTDLLQAADPTVDVELVTLETHADQRLDIPISELGGKGAFSKEVQARVLGGYADIAVHSAKDLQAVTPDGLSIGAFPERGDPRDALVGSTLDQLGYRDVVATGSNRRQAQLGHLRPDLRFEGLRGNIGTRLAKASEYGAIVMAAAALERLGLAPEDVEILEPDVMIPQVGQGALAVECRQDDAGVLKLLAQIDHRETRIRVETERAFLTELGGDCDLPAGAYCRPLSAEVTQKRTLLAMLADVESGQFERLDVEVDPDDHTAAGRTAAIQLRNRLSAGRHQA